jgi:hypothetical protein
MFLKNEDADIVESEILSYGNATSLRRTTKILSLKMSTILLKDS